MPAHRISMRKFREVLRLAHQQKRSTREIAAAVRLSHTTVRNYLQRAAKASLTWPLPEDLAHSALEARLFPKQAADSVRRPVPDWPAIHEELKAKGVTKQLLWKEYRQQHPDGYGYSWFCERYQDWKKTQDLVMRQYHAPGDQRFVDYAGKTVEVYDPDKGENTLTHKSLWRCWAIPTTPTRRRPDRSLPGTGSPRTTGPSNTSGPYPPSSFRVT